VQKTRDGDDQAKSSWSYGYMGNCASGKKTGELLSLKPSRWYNRIDKGEIMIYTYRWLTLQQPNKRATPQSGDR
jgi:hypothetical protein